ncbi:hypothetical protein [Neobacillus sp. PS3-40]|jgi:uncharacterized membrane protein|uniref:HAAS signaling domain-containing protein n=1 Tax=Neobacillus sp. PS3-40 TaxID=3070679 RepID=UPI0027DFF2A4|nr:hypothetical protein [Neobacillus sp. PS3-40]WML44046.1 hypothetical protein RCG20_20055 [Neobacillus sp. PS3-40]
MEQSKNRFLNDLSNMLGSLPEKDDILKEYEMHIDDILLEIFDDQDKEVIFKQIVSRLGSPDEIAQMWKEELSVTPSNMKWLFILLNIIFFTFGGLLTLFHNIYQWNWLTVIWSNLTAIPTMIALIYLFFWGLLGYEIGKGFGHRGKVLLKKTFLLSLIPNLLLMLLTIFKIIPPNWFAPLLTNQFIIACILFTAILYPVCWIGYRWGKKASV